MDSIDINNIHVPPGINFPRISPQGFIVAIFVFLTIAIIGAVTRISLRIVRLKKFDLDDAFLILALASLTATCVMMKLLGNISYIQIYANLGLIQFPVDLGSLLYDHQLLQAASVLEWVSIYAAKISLLLFFKKLVVRIIWLERLWWTVMILVAVSACICIPLGFMVCTDFSVNFIKTCPAKMLDVREGIYLDVSTAFDIFTDILILSIPIGLLWTVKMKLRRKMALFGMLGLSVFMIVIATIRIAGSELPGGITDAPWVFFWQIMEAAVAVTMVALTGFRSLFQGNGKLSSQATDASGQVPMPTTDSLGSYNQETYWAKATTTMTMTTSSSHMV